MVLLIKQAEEKCLSACLDTKIDIIHPVESDEGQSNFEQEKEKNSVQNCTNIHHKRN